MNDADFVDALDVFYAGAARRCVLFCGAVKEHLADVFQVLPNEITKVFSIPDFLGETLHRLTVIESSGSLQKQSVSRIMTVIL